MTPDVVSPVVTLSAADPALWLDPNSYAAATQRTPIALQGLPAVVIGPTRTLPERTIPFGAGAERGFSARFTGIVDSGGVVAGDLRLSLRAYEADLWRGALQTGTTAVASQALQSVASQMLFVAETGDAKGENFGEPADSAALTSNFRAKDLLDRQGDTLSLHVTGRPIPEMEPGPRTQVRDLIRIYGPRQVSLDLELPANWKTISELATSGNTGRFLKWSESRRVEAGRLHIDREVEVLHTSLAAADYAGYLAEEKAMNLAFDRPVLFRAAR
jgi:hypothetical protein